MKRGNMTSQSLGINDTLKPYSTHQVKYRTYALKVLPAHFSVFSIAARWEVGYIFQDELLSASIFFMMSAESVNNSPLQLICGTVCGGFKTCFNFRMSQGITRYGIFWLSSAAITCLQ